MKKMCLLLLAVICLASCGKTSKDYYEEYYSDYQYDYIFEDETGYELQISNYAMKYYDVLEYQEDGSVIFKNNGVRFTLKEKRYVGNRRYINK